MDENIIDRVASKIDADDFLRLTTLHLEHEWLQDEPKALFELWCLSDEEEQKKLIEFLIMKFTYIDTKKLSEGCRLLAGHIEGVWGLGPANTFLVATCGDPKPDGSQSLIQSLKNKFSNGWRENNFYNYLPTGANEIRDNSTLILVDDFIGTGDTIVRKYEYVRKTLVDRKLNNVVVKLICLAAMGFSKGVLDSLKIDYHCIYWLNKGISELVPEEERDISTKSMISLESKLKEKHNSRILPNFGYKGSEALFALASNNIPNNVFPIFWWPYLKNGLNRKTIFRRV